MSEREPGDPFSPRWPDRPAHLSIQIPRPSRSCAERPAQASESPLFATLLDSSLVAIDAKEYRGIVASGAKARTARNIAADLLTLPPKEPSSSAVGHASGAHLSLLAMANLLGSQPDWCL